MFNASWSIGPDGRQWKLRYAYIKVWNEGLTMYIAKKGSVALQQYTTGSAPIRDSYSQV